MSVFDQRKAKILQDLASDEPDLSPKGRPDDGVLALLELLNANHDYMTTSSCSGRAVIYLDADKGGQGDDAKGRWLMNRHTSFTEDELSQTTQEQLQAIFFGDLKIGLLHSSSTSLSRLISFKYEPLIVHVLCRDITTASRLLHAATSSGYRESGMSISGHATPQEKIIVAVRTTSFRLDIPLASYDSESGTINPLSSDTNYLTTLLKLANLKFKENEQRKKSLMTALQSLTEQQTEITKETKEGRRLRKREEGLRLQASTKAIKGNYSTGEGIRYGDTLDDDDDKSSDYL